MEGIHDIYLGEQQVGSAEVTREGLYYRFRCSCSLEGNSVCRVNVCGQTLGVLIPRGELFCLETKLPAKRFANKIPIFSVQPNRPVLEGRFIPISPEEPFAYISRLKNAHLARQDGQLGIVIKKEAGT